MKTSNKLLAAGALVVAIGAASAFALADRGHGPGSGRMGPDGWGGPGHGMMRGMGPGGRREHGPNGEGRMGGAFGDPTARLAALKTELAIKPEQAADWDAYAKIVTETSAAMTVHRDTVDREAVRKMEPKDRQDFMTAHQKLREEHLEKVKSAAESLLGKLDANQQTKAKESLPGLASVGRNRGPRHGMMGGSGGRHAH
jgi:hypothetical protein